MSKDKDEIKKELLAEVIMAAFMEPMGDKAEYQTHLARLIRLANDFEWFWPESAQE